MAERSLQPRLLMPPMRLICFSLFKRGQLPRAIKLLLLIFPIFLGALPAQAAVSCSGSIEPYLIYYKSGQTLSAGSYGPKRISVSCYGLTVGLPYQICTKSDVATSIGTGGTSASPTRQARSSTGDYIQWQLYNSSKSADLAAEIMMGATPSASAATLALSNGSSIGIRIPQQTVAANDYQTVVPITIGVEQASSCSAANPVVATFTLNIPVTIRTASSCDFAGAVGNINILASGAMFGNITVSSGTTIAANTMQVYTNQACPDGLAYNLNFSEGLYSTGTGANRRRMANGTSYIMYGIFTNSAATTSFPTSGVNLTGKDSALGYTTGERLFYFKMPAQDVPDLTPGIYSDTLIMTLTW
ncbi:MAG TPA: spore coat protein U domain-containing protein [Variovorax sp.]|nr:spore coat protein U domain-containing protein [Variovorax sp.]